MSTSQDLGLSQGLAVVTGASSGIGFELAKRFALNGFDLLIAAEDEGIESAVEELRVHGTHVEGLRVDLATYEGVEQLYEKIQNGGVPVEALVLNAGVGVSGEFAKDTSLFQELNLIQLNIVSVVHLAKKVMGDMVARQRGRVLFTSSVASTMPGPYYAVYAASKAFVQSFAEAVRVEVKDSGVIVTSLMPGATDTNFFERAHMEDTGAGQMKKDDPAVVAKQGFDALMAGDDKVVAGTLLNKVQAAVGKMLPHSISAKMHAAQTKPLKH